MSFIAPTVSAAVAWKRAHRPPLARTRRFLHRALSLLRTGDEACKLDLPQTEHGRLPYLEVVWLPYYHARVEVRRRDQGRTADVLVCGSDGTTNLCDVATLKWLDGEPPPPLLATISREEAADAACRAVLGLVARQGWSGKPPTLHVADVADVHYPVWVYYYERRRGRLDVRLVDALNARLTGGKMKAALIAALTETPPASGS